MFYVSADDKGNWDVVDGLQRLTTIKEFILENEEDRGKGFKLQKLEFWGNDYNKLNFNALPKILVNRILETEFRFTVINPGTPEEVKRNIFKRINTGGMPLTSQEIRHALYQGKSTELLKELAESEDFKTAIGDSVDDSRMAARELVLRFLAFSIRTYKDYEKNSDMDKFLSDTMRIINIMPELKVREIKKIFKDSTLSLRFSDIETLMMRFKEGMTRSYELFGNNAFRRSFGNKRRSPINKTLFEVWGNLLADLNEYDFECLIQNNDNFLEEYRNVLMDQDFGNLISRDSWKYKGVQSRYKKLKEVIDHHIEK